MSTFMVQVHGQMLIAKQRKPDTGHKLCGVITALFQILPPAELNLDGNRVSGNSSDVGGNL